VYSLSREKPSKTVSAESLLEDITFLTRFSRRLTGQQPAEDTPHKDGR
jgi:hypothetical protein